MKKNILLLLVILSVATISKAQYLTTDDSAPIENIVQDSLITGCVTASNITTNSSDAYGYFSNSNPDFPFTSGLIMASGPIENAIGPDYSNAQTGSVGTGSDPDLAMLTPYSVNDATIIEFDFVPASDTIRFNYIFGSEEFPEFANNIYNDVFGFFISGPGISGPYSNNAINIALLPNGDPVTIDNVFNSGTWYNGPTSGNGATGEAYNHVVQYDGCTVPLTAEVILTACETYHIKLAVGDAGDSALDTGVFIEAGSFTSGVQITAINHSDVGSESDLFEGCTNYFVLERAPNSPIDEEVVIYINYLGGSSAEELVDVSDVVDSVYIAPYETQDTIWYTAFNDGIEEGTETMILEFWTSCPCGNGGGNTVVDTIFIYDVESIKGGIQDVETNYCGTAPPPSLDLVGEVDISPAYYLWSTGSTNSTITIVPVLGETTYYLTISDQCGNELYDNVTVRVSTMSIESIDVTDVSCYNECDGEITVNAANGFQPFTYTYASANFFYIPDSLTVTMDNTFTGLCPKNYYIKVTDDIGCQYETTTQVFNQPNIQLSDGIITPAEIEYCGNPGNISLTASAIVDNPTYTWWNNTHDATVTFTPNLGVNTYAISITDACGNLFTDYIDISVSELSASTGSEPDINAQCNGEAWANPADGIAPYSYYWYNPIALFGQHQEDLCAGEYTVQVTDNIGCSEEVNVEVQSLVSISNTEQGVNIYPNPAKHSAYIDLSELQVDGATIVITNLTGQLIGEFSTTKSIFRTPDLSAGTYYVDIIVHDKHILKDKLIITE